jgi:hypothetical protein
VVGWSGEARFARADGAPNIATATVRKIVAAAADSRIWARHDRLHPKPNVGAVATYKSAGFQQLLRSGTDTGTPSSRCRVVPADQVRSARYSSSAERNLPG